MTLSTEQLKHLATLAYLQLDDKTTPQLISDMNAFIECVAQLQQIDTSTIEPLRHPLDAYQRLRPDEAQVQDGAEKLAHIAPQFNHNLYLVPKVISTEG
jgi:aspartyl-tRNA(Asn)/glutamyl-tRNA(Gln) amidotransferase subunit C